MDMAKNFDSRWAWEAYQPTEKEPWDLRKVGHLYRRASFGASWEELQTGLKSGPEKTIESLLHGGPGQKEFDQQTAPLARSIAQSNNGRQASAWWVYRMLYSPHPLREKLTLFWHNHFATSDAKVNNAGFMLGQYELLSRHALGKFGTLLTEISRDSAMMVWLDTSLSKRKMPNENYARELMELFSLGLGHYTETDIRQAARAFTGWEIKEGKAVFDPGQHDRGVKTVLGKTGNWTGDDVVRICLDQPAAAMFVVAKLFRFLVSETVRAAPELLEPLADQFRKSDYDFGALVERVLRSNLFFSPQVYRTRIKSPVDFSLGIVRALEGRVGASALSQVLGSLGQNLFYPPSVKGWDGGATWLNGQTLLTRQNLALALTSTEDARFGRRTDPAALARKYGKSAKAEVTGFFLDLFLQGDVPDESRAKLLHYEGQAQGQKYPAFWTAQDADDYRIRALCHLVLTLPEVQLD
jgi:uncharacterized protein (DUF1800 family)